MNSRGQSPWIIAHRGARNEAPENSFTALERALTYDIDGLEFDVQMSRDGVPLLYHDTTLQKVGAGRKHVSDLALSDLEKIDWGKWFHSRFIGEPAPLLTKALTLLDRCPLMCIEIKSSRRDQTTGWALELTRKVMDEIAQPAIQAHKDRIRILSFDPEVLALAHQSDDSLRYLLNIETETPIETKMDTDHLWAVGVAIGKLSEKSIQWARQRNLHVLTYTCNGPRQLKRALRLGVDGIITDRPGWLGQTLGRF